MKVLVVGAGQSGLHLAHGLLGVGVDVTVVTAQSSTELRASAPAITQVSYPQVLEYERELHLDFWSAQAPHIQRVAFALYPGQAPAMTIEGSFAGYAVAVDRRIKLADWLEYFEDRGGRVVINGCTVSDLDYFTRMYDLIVVAVGHGELGALFPADRRRWAGARPRALTQVLLAGVDAAPNQAEVVSSPHGRVLLVPVLTAGGPAHSLCVMDAPGQPLDGTPLQPRIGHPHPGRVLEWITTVVQPFAALQERLRDATPIDGRSALVTTVYPQVRHPVGALPSGGRVVGLADAVIATDPMAVQGWNNSSRCARSYLRDILTYRTHRIGEIDKAFLTALFTRFWNGSGQASAVLSDALDALWTPAAPAHLAEVFTAIREHPRIGDRFVRGLDEPADYQQWLYEPEKFHAYLKEVIATS